MLQKNVEHFLILCQYQNKKLILCQKLKLMLINYGIMENLFRNTKYIYIALIWFHVHVLDVTLLEALE